MEGGVSDCGRATVSGMLGQPIRRSSTARLPVMIRKAPLHFLLPISQLTENTGESVSAQEINPIACLL